MIDSTRSLQKTNCDMDDVEQRPHLHIADAVLAQL